MQPMHLKRIISTSLSAEYLCKLFELLLYGRLVSSPVFIYSVIYYISTDSWMFVLYLGYHRILHCLFYCSNCSSFGWRTLSVSPCRSDTPSSFCCWSTSLLSGITRFSRSTLHSLYPSPRNIHFSKES